jgi:hypothetical protein
MTGNEDLRAAAEKRLSDQANFKRLAGVFVIVWAILIAVWALSGRGYFWPIWAIFGMGIALAFMGWGAYGPRPSGPTQDQIDAEMRKMGEPGEPGGPA